MLSLFVTCELVDCWVSLCCLLCLTFVCIDCYMRVWHSQPQQNYFKSITMLASRVRTRHCSLIILANSVTFPWFFHSATAKRRDHRSQLYSHKQIWIGVASTESIQNNLVTLSFQSASISYLYHECHCEKRSEASLCAEGCPWVESFNEESVNQVGC